MTRTIFPKGFLWGVATASYQIEGGYRDDGKGESIWDRFTHIPGKISDGNNGDVACDAYHLYPQDIKIMKELGLNSYRFSISWPRVLPDGRGKPNLKGLDYYKKLVAMLVENGIEPMVTLYHWDLPQKLQDIGGWANRDVVDYFDEFARLMYKELGDDVPVWITHNEPSVVAFIGNWAGVHAPGITDFSTALLVSHHLILSHSKAVKAYRESGLKGEIGIVLAMSTMYPASQDDGDVEATVRNDGYWNRWFTDPVLKGTYPMDMVEWYTCRGLMPEIPEEDLKIIGTPIDFLGVNMYYAYSIKANKKCWPLELEKDFIGEDRTEMGWGINPEGYYDLLLRLHKDYAGIKIYLTENGTAYKDVVNRKGEVEDDNRIDFIYRYLVEVDKAIKEGVNIGGYFVWTLMDNFEWAYGFSKRFGIVYMDNKTLKRIIKKSGYWYKDVIKNNGFQII